MSSACCLCGSKSSRWSLCSSSMRLLIRLIGFLNLIRSISFVLFRRPLALFGDSSSAYSLSASQYNRLRVPCRKSLYRERVSIKVLISPFSFASWVLRRYLEVAAHGILLQIGTMPFRNTRVGLIMETLLGIQGTMKHWGPVSWFKNSSMSSRIALRSSFSSVREISGSMLMGSSFFFFSGLLVSGSWSYSSRHCWGFWFICLQWIE